VDRLHYPPRVFNREVGTEIVKSFEESRFCPTLFFIDPWGYKGLSLRLVNSVLKDWGCDCIFFFNYNRINMGLNNPIVQEHMNALFTADKADKLRGELEMLAPEQRELVIVENLAQALKYSGDEYRYVLPFRFKDDRGRRTSHHLIFVSKNFLGYEIMKEIMAKESTASVDGVASFEYNPADTRQPLLFELSRPLTDLAGQLSKSFAGQTLTMQDIYIKHNVNRPYIKANYKDVLNEMEAQGLIAADPVAAKRQMRQGKRTFGDNVKVTFPYFDAERKE
jgi:hypothetical protein